MYVTTEIFVILFLFKCVFCTLTPVARVIHTFRNFLFKNQSKRRYGILQVFLGVLLRVSVCR